LLPSLNTKIKVGPEGGSIRRVFSFVNFKN
jgi:hypothetical protein